LRGNSLILVKKVVLEWTSVKIFSIVTGLSISERNALNEEIISNQKEFGSGNLDKLNRVSFPLSSNLHSIF